MCSTPMALSRNVLAAKPQAWGVVACMPMGFKLFSEQVGLPVSHVALKGFFSNDDVSTVLLLQTFKHAAQSHSRLRCNTSRVGGIHSA
jgi:hypothetical protein